MKNLVLCFVICLLVCFGCEDNEDTVRAQMIYDGSNQVSEEMATWSKEDLAEAARTGAVFNVERDQDFELNRALNIGVNKLAVVVCDPFGWGAEYDWLCTMDGTKGRVIAIPDEPPTWENLITYLESGSESYPGDILTTTFFNKDYYTKYGDTSVNFNILRGLLAVWGAAWVNARINFCDVGNPNGTHIHCVQE